MCWADYCLALSISEREGFVVVVVEKEVLERRFSGVVVKPYKLFFARLQEIAVSTMTSIHGCRLTSNHHHHRQRSATHLLMGRSVNVVNDPFTETATAIFHADFGNRLRSCLATRRRPAARA